MDSRLFRDSSAEESSQKNRLSLKGKKLKLNNKEKFQEMKRKDHFKGYKSYIYSRCYIYCIPLEKWRTAYVPNLHI